VQAKTPLQENDPGLNWYQVQKGIEYRDFYLADPNHVYVARMERDNPQVTIESSIAQGKLNGGLETVSNMASRYDQAINYWGETWGGRNEVVIAINGYFYDTTTGIPWRGQVHSSWYSKRFDDLENGSGFAWTLDQNAFIGGCIRHRPTKQFVTHVPTGQTQFFQGINIPRGEDELIIYTPQYDTHTYTDNTGVEILVKMSRPMMILPAPRMITGTVESILDKQGSAPIPFDHIVLSASGDIRKSILGVLAEGDTIGISQEISNYETDCSTPLPDAWPKTYASVGGSFRFLRNGTIQSFDDVGAVVRNPRTAIAYNDKYVYFIVVDGRDPFASVGMSIVELAVFAKNTLGAIEGIALDGGGSSTIVVDGEVKNNPNADLTKYHKIYLPIALNKHPIGVQPFGVSIAEATIPKKSGISASNKLERAVANGMMMVIVQPKEQSTTYQPQTQVVTVGVSDIPIHLGPGTNYGVLTTLAPNIQGVVLAHDLDGVLATGSYWWHVAFQDVSGWVSEEALKPIGQ
jgi:hypothetical protein